MSYYYIEQLVSRFLAYYMKNGFNNKLPPGNLDIRTITDPIVDFMNAEVFFEGSEQANEPDAPEFHSLSGNFCCHCGDYLFTQPQYKIISLLLDDDCRYEDGILEGYVDLDHLVLIMPDVDDSTSQLLLTPQTYALAESFVASFDRRFFFEEYLDLPEEQRRILHRFLTRPGFAQYITLCVSYLATVMIQKGHTLSPNYVPEVLKAVRLHTFRFPHVCFERCDADAMMVLLNLCGFFQKEAAWYMAPAMFAIMNKVSAWCLPPEDGLLVSGLAGSPYLYRYLDLIATPAQVRSLSRAIVEPQIHDSDPGMCNHILRQLLYTNTPLEASVIAEINRYLFNRTILELEDIHKLIPIRKCKANWEVFLDDLFEKVSNELAKEKTCYIPILALAWICNIGSWKDALSDAEEMVLEGESQAAILVGLEMLNFFLRYDLTVTGKKKLPIHLNQAQPILEKVAGYLMAPDIYYEPAAVLAQNLVLSGTIDPSPLLNPRIKKVALARYKQGQLHSVYPCLLLHLIEKINEWRNPHDY